MGLPEPLGLFPAPETGKLIFFEPLGPLLRGGGGAALKGMFYTVEYGVGVYLDASEEHKRLCPIAEVQTATGNGRNFAQSPQGPLGPKGPRGTPWGPHGAHGVREPWRA